MCISAQCCGGILNLIIFKKNCLCADDYEFSPDFSPSFSPSQHSDHTENEETIEGKHMNKEYVLAYLLMSWLDQEATQLTVLDF